MNNALPALGLGVLFAASLSQEAIMRAFKCDKHAALAFKEQAQSDLGNIQMQIDRARMVNQ